MAQENAIHQTLPFFFFSFYKVIRIGAESAEDRDFVDDALNFSSDLCRTARAKSNRGIRTCRTKFH